MEIEKKSPFQLDSLALTDKQKQEYLKSKVDAFNVELKKIEDSLGLQIIACLEYSVRGIIPRVIVVPKDKDVQK